MAFAKYLIAASITLLSVSAPAQAQVNTVVEPVTQYKTLDSLPIEITEAGVIKAQHIRPGDISPEEYQKLLEEADRVRAYQSNSHAYTGVSYDAVQSSVPVTVPVTTSSVPYEIEFFETPVSEPAPVTYSSAPITITTEPVTRTVSGHYVIKGDTLYNISKRYNVTIAALKAANGLTDDGVQLGQRLAIPSNMNMTVTNSTVIAPVTTQSSPTYVRTVEPVPVQTSTNGIYAVLPGDTLFAISRRACVNVSAIQQANGISNPSALQPGQRLTMPAGHCL